MLKYLAVFAVAICAAQAGIYCGFCEKKVSSYFSQDLVTSVYAKAAPRVCVEAFNSSASCFEFISARKDYLINEIVKQGPQSACTALGYCSKTLPNEFAATAVGYTPCAISGQTPRCNTCLCGLRFVVDLFRSTGSADTDLLHLVDSACKLIPISSQRAGCTAGVNGALGAITGAVMASLTTDICYENLDCLGPH